MDVWYFVRLIGDGHYDKKVHILTTDHWNADVMLTTVLGKNVQCSGWHGSHDWNLALNRVGPPENWQEHDVTKLKVMPDWELQLRYDGDPNKYRQILCRGAPVFYKYFKIVVYHGFTQDGNGDEKCHCVMFLSRRGGGAHPGDGIALELLTLCGSQAPGSSNQSNAGWSVAQSSADDDDPSWVEENQSVFMEDITPPDTLGLDLVKILRNNGIGNKKVHDAMRTRLKAVMESDRYRSGRNIRDKPLFVSWEMSKEVDDSPDIPGGAPLWMQWAAKFLRDDQIHKGFKAFWFQFRTRRDPNQEYRPRCDMFLQHFNGQILVAHVGIIPKHNAKLYLLGSTMI